MTTGNTTAAQAAEVMEKLRDEATVIGARYKQERETAEATKRDEVVPMVLALTDLKLVQREIAELMSISHQLVHQIQTAHGRTRPRRKRAEGGS